MRRGCLAAPILLAAVIVAAVLWFDHTGTFSHANYERIRPGMTVAEVERLLGGPGTEVQESQLPRVVDWQVPPEHPKRVKPVVAGERYLRWAEGPKYILVSLRGDVVAEKWYWEPSL